MPSLGRLFCPLLLLLAIPGTSRAQVTIPLTVFDSNQLGITVRLGTATNPFTYLLDTGSVGFLSAAGSSPAWSGAFASLSTNETFNISYGGGGLDYRGVVAHTTVTFPTTGGGSLVVPDVRMGAITNQPREGWNGSINQDPPQPPENGQFFGTMGAGLNSSPPGNGGFTSILGQIPLDPGLGKGFVIHTGGPGSTNATLTVGLTGAILQSFPILLPMQPSLGVATNDNGTTVALYPQAQTVAGYTLASGDDIYTATADFIMDTGGLDTYLTTGSDLNPPASLLSTNPLRLLDGASFTVAVSGTNNPLTQQPADGLSWVFDPTGTNAYQNLVSVFNGGGPGSLNSGIPLFYQYDVMFDTDRGLIGLRPVPEPSTIALAGIALAAALCWRRRG